MERKIKLILKDILLYKNHTNILMIGDNNILENIVNDLIKDTLVLDLSYYSNRGYKKQYKFIRIL